MPKIRKSAKLSKTSAIKARAIEAEELEKKKLGIKREMEKIMAEINPYGEPDTAKPKLVGRTIMVNYSPK